jgi:pimeloyl-ACP methyl ester carboxylesterase
VRRVVLSATRQGKRVILGGHSLGASMTAAYASWDFDGHPGYEDLEGLVLIDGGLLGSFSTPDLAATKKAIKALDTNGPFVDLLGLKLPWAAGVFAEAGAVATLKEPTAPSTAQSFPLLPAMFKPPIPATNRGLFGYAFDASTSPKARSLIHVQAGMLGPNGDWVDGEVTPIERLAQTFGQEPANAAEWYFPAKLSIDVDAVNALTRNAQADYLKLRPWHRRAVDLPLYALQTDLTHGRVLRGARRFIAGSKVPRADAVLVDASGTESHLDPLTAAPDRNRFLQTVVPFLRKLRGSTP